MKSGYYMGLIFLGLGLLACQPGTPAIQPGKMTLMPAAYTQVDFVNQLKDTEIFNILNYLYYYNGGGVAIGDINQDSLPDLFFTANLLPNRLYLNRGNFQFEDITHSAGVGGQNSWSTGVSMVDLNGDGWLDIYVCQLGDYLDKKGHNELWLNNGDLTFREASAEYGLDLVGFSTQATFFDYDRDGDLDLFQLNHSIRPSETVGDTNQRSVRDPLAGDKLLRNEGGRFVDVSAEAGILGSRLGYGLSVLTGDLNGDLWPDLYICNDFHEDDYLYLNQGNGRFRESLTEMLGHTSRFSMGSDLVDLNDDGRLDLMTLDMKPEREQILKTAESPEPYDIFQFKRSFGYHYQYPHNALQLNLGTDPAGQTRFAEIAQLLGVDATDWSWSALFADWNNDGREDLYITNGIYRRPNDMDYIKFISKPEIARQLNGEPSREELAFIEQMPSVRLPNPIYQQTGELEMQSKTENWGMNQPAFSNGAAYADLDRDGDLDLVVNNINEPAFLYRNDLPSQAYLRLQLTTANGQSPAIGARAEVWAGKHYKMRELYPVRGFESCMEPILHVGLGATEQIDSLRIRWPNGAQSRYYQLAARQEYLFSSPEPVGKPQNVKPQISEPQKEVLPANREPANREPKSWEPFFVHRENLDVNRGGFNDFRRESLIPRLLSTEGPALAAADVNGDGLTDVYLGGAMGQAGQLFFQSKAGAFVPQSTATWEADRLQEDIDAIWFDADGDADLDLFVVSGGNQFQAGDLLNQDRLYLNQGQGNFVPAPAGSLPALRENGACARAADWDQDGDLDLVVGNRSVPGSYGLSPPMNLLENKGGGRFEEITPQQPAFTGMITDMAWDDFDGDGDADLFVVGEWQPIRLYENTHGTLQLREVPAFAFSDGWWNAIEGADFDGDGDTDWLVGNWGLNASLQASPEEPCTLYVMDFDGNGATDPILCEYNEGVSYPVASKDELLSQVVSLRRQFVQYADYAEKTAVDIWGKDQLAKATVKQVYTFASVYVENQGGGNFEIRPLPQAAQFAPIFAISILGPDRNGLPMAMVAGNFYGVGPNLGRFDASFGGVLRGTGQEQFAWIAPAGNRFWIEGESRAMQILQLAYQQKGLLVAKNNGPVQLLPLPLPNIDER